VTGELNCPYCLWPITADESAQSCGYCSATYHRECWSENRGCGTFGCPSWSTSSPRARRAPAPTTEAVDGRVVVTAEMDPPSGVARFCDMCGQAVLVDDRFCGLCGNTL